MKAKKITCNLLRKWDVPYINFNQETINELQKILDNSKNKIWTIKICKSEVYWFESKFNSLENPNIIKVNYLLININNLEQDLNNL